MATDTSSFKSRRKFTTYGKAAHHEDYDFEVPVSPEGSDVDHGRLPGPRRLLQMQKSSRTPNHSQSPKRRAGKHSDPQYNARDDSMLSKKQQTLSHGFAAEDENLFDVPSSDEDRPLSGSPLKPAVKRRKVPGKSSVGTLAPISTGSASRAGKEENNLRRPPSTATTRKKAPERVGRQSSESKGKLDSTLAGENLHQSTPGTLGPQENEKFRNDFGKRKALNVEDGENILSSVSRSTFLPASSKEKVHVAAKLSRNGYGAKNRSRSTSESPDCLNSLPVLQTSPSERGRPRGDALEVDYGHKNSDQDVFSFMSPSGLDFPGLEITAVGNLSLSNAGSSANTITPASHRLKMKDRLADRDGTTHAKYSDTQLSPPEDEIHTTGDDSQFTSQGLLANKHESQQKSVVSLSEQSTSSDPRILVGTGMRNTYAARNRTLRKDESVTEDDMFATLADVHESASSTGVRRIKIGSQHRSSQENAKDTIDSDDLEDEQPSLLQNIHDLREAGASARLHGETEALLDEVESSNQSTRRSGLLGLLSKLEKPAFRDRFATDGLESRLIRRIHEELDFISKVLLSMALLQIIASQISPQAIERLRSRNAYTLVEALLKEEETVRSIARNRKSNTSKAFQQELEHSCQTFLKAPVWRLGLPESLTPQIIALQLLGHLAKYARKSPSTQEVFPTSIMELLTRILASYLAPISSAPPAPDSLGSRLVLSILESATSGHVESDHSPGESWYSRLLELLSRILVSASEQKMVGDGMTFSLLLRLGLNLTNNNATACALFARSSLISSFSGVIEELFTAAASSDTDSELHVAIVDNLVLSLGLLINLAENSSSARKSFLQPESDGHNSLDTLLQIFIRKWVKAFEVTSEQESRESVPLGYLAVLLAFICMESSNRNYVKSRLADGSLKHLLIAVKAFLGYHQKVADELQSEEEGELKASFVGRVQTVMDQLTQC